MYLVKGFGINANTAINTPGIINFFGELSTQSLTYTKEKGMYKNPAVAGVGLITFKCERQGALVELPTTHSNHVINVINRVFSRVINSRNSSFLMGQLLQELTEQFVGISEAFRGGLIVSEAGYYCPDWIEWRYASDRSTFKIWFIDEVFRNQYDEYILEFAGPTTNLDNFFAGGASVQTMLENITPNMIVDSLQTIKGEDPETFIRLETYNYHDPYDDTRIVPSHWGMVGYGIAANNSDVSRQGLIDFILNNSTHSREEWAVILPDLFKRTEFVLVPLWDQEAIPSRTTTAGVYSPFGNAKRASDLLKRMLPGYALFQIDQYMELTGFPHKSVSVASVGSAENNGSRFLLKDFYPDYISVSTTSLDFNRMSEKTSLWAIQIAELISYAEITTPSTGVPLTLSKLYRDGNLYLSRMIDNVQYLVATRHSVLEMATRP